MSGIAIKVEGLYKQYQLGVVGTGTLSHDLNRWWHKVRGKEDPYEKVTVTNLRETSDGSEFVWAVQDINFEVKQGEVLGIIGKNGAGKSTLLKILSKVTTPTRGHVKIKGRIASLLEVGTGFHPELTGRENIYLNGAILGMTRNEIKSKFDEIVAFSGVEKYIDTPVKRYSSGMYVRLAFAVAAHLEPEILIVDEVLAVGDAEFQKKCLGKMKDVSGEGRTVLFVSHNMAAVKSLCNRGICLQSGKVYYEGLAADAVEEYLKKQIKNIEQQQYVNADIAPGNKKVKLNCCKVSFEKNKETGLADVSGSIEVLFDFWLMEDSARINLSLHLFNAEGTMIFNIHTPVVELKPGLHKSICSIPGHLLNDGNYYINMMVVKNEAIALYNFEECLSFTLQDFREGYSWHGKWPGIIRPTFIPFKFI